eukprot:gene13300-biopygen3498
MVWPFGLPTVPTDYCLWSDVCLLAWFASDYTRTRLLTLSSLRVCSHCRACRDSGQTTTYSAMHLSSKSCSWVFSRHPEDPIRAPESGTATLTPISHPKGIGYRYG